jgi:hypothetical protein
MRTRLYTLLSLLLILAALSGCTTFTKPAGIPIKPGPAPPVQGLETGPKVEKPKSAYDLHELLVPVIQYSILVSSAESFSDFVEKGSGGFTDQIYQVFTLEKDGFKEGEGTVLTAYREGAVYTTVDRSLLKNNTDGSRWWQIQLTVPEAWVFCEILISDLETPLEVRYIHPDTGKKYKTTPIFADELKETLKEFSKEELRQMMAEDRRILIEQEYQKLFQNPIAIGEEQVTTGGGEFNAVHIRDKGKKVGSMFDYWVSDKVPGGIVKIRRRNADGSVDIVELTGITQDNISQIRSSEAVEPEFSDSAYE